VAAILSAEDGERRVNGVVDRERSASRAGPSAAARPIPADAPMIARTFGMAGLGE